MLNICIIVHAYCIIHDCVSYFYMLKTKLQLNDSGVGVTTHHGLPVGDCASVEGEVRGLSMEGCLWWGMACGVVWDGTGWEDCLCTPIGKLGVKVGGRLCESAWEGLFWCSSYVHAL